jgi:integrase
MTLPSPFAMLRQKSIRVVILILLTTMLISCTSQTKTPLDTDLRASELCTLRIGDVDMKTGKVTIRPGLERKAKGRKGRTVYVG